LNGLKEINESNEVRGFMIWIMDSL
jgi:hypothetical protein